MQRFLTFFSLLIVAGMAAQAQNVRSLGHIPPYFNLPAEGEQVRFTSLEQPEFAVPEYPDKLQHEGKEGVVEVTCYVTSEGDVVYSEISVSSGNDAFDRQALKSALETSFPNGYATVGGTPTDFTIEVPFYFLLSADPEQYWHTRLELARIEQDYDELMETFQGYVSKRTEASEQTMKRTRTQLETKIAAAKKLYRLLAEKKESAILRLRDQIASTRADIENMEYAKRDVDTRVHGEATAVEVKVSLPQSGVMTLLHTNSEGTPLEKLASEIEIKKAYL